MNKFGILEGIQKKIYEANYVFRLFAVDPVIHLLEASLSLSSRYILNFFIEFVATDVGMQSF